VNDRRPDYKPGHVHPGIVVIATVLAACAVVVLVGSILLMTHQLVIR
jgi:hypothetical protein